MIPMTVEEIRAAAQGRWCSQGADIPVEGISIDSRSAKPGDLFVAIRGERFDGHDYLSQASQAGCIAAIVDQKAVTDGIAGECAGRFGAGMIEVEDTVQALGYLATTVRKRMTVTTVVAVTGSNGKTTVKRMIDHILSKTLKGTASPKSFNNNIGVPLTLLGTRQMDDYVVCEVGTNAPGEIDTLARLALPHISVITSVGLTHLEKLNSLAQVATEKATLLNWTSEDGLAVVWGDNPELNRAVKFYQARMIRFGFSDENELRIMNYSSDGQNCRFCINGRVEVFLPVPGRHNALNALAAVAVAQRFGISQEQAVEALKDFGGVEMRLQRHQVDGVTVINDAYNANPTSLAAAVETLCEIPQARKVLVVGDMRELGDAAESLHTQAGEDIAQKDVDFLITVGALGRYIATGAQSAGMNADQVKVFESIEPLAHEISSLLQDGDVVLLKGSRAMGMERLLDAIDCRNDNPGK